jgi:hypothetical protein
MAGHKKGSDVFAVVIGGGLVVLAALTFAGWSPDLKDKETVKLLTGGSSLLFGSVLLLWCFGENKEWGVGFESVTMIVGVVTAVIAIFALLHG